MFAGAQGMKYTRYRVLRPIDAEAGLTAPVADFGAAGSATQYLPGGRCTVEELVTGGFLEEI